MTQIDLSQKLKNITNARKKKLLLTEIGYLRINLFQEYYERIQIAQKTKDPDKAIQLMKTYIETIAMPFIQERLNPSVLSRITRPFSKDKTPNAAKVLQEWKTSYEKWTNPREMTLSNQKNRIEQFDQIKRTFITLYTISFSFGNFPPVATEPFH